MSSNDHAAIHFREPILSPVDRVSEALFGLFMALTFVGAVSVAQGGRAEIREMLVAALGCNLAWGLVDAVMYVVGAIVDRGRWLLLVRSVRATPDANGAHRLIEQALARAPAGDLVSAPEIEAMRRRIMALPDLPAHATLERDDALAAVWIFLIVVGSTFPVVLPFVMFEDVALAQGASRAIALAMLFCGGFALGRYAGYGAWKAGFMLAGIGAVLVAAIIALGG